jgi:hypothetical protein
MKTFGKYVVVKQRNNISTEKEKFVEIINGVESCWERSKSLEENFMLDISSYDDYFYIIIESLIYLHYGEWKGDIILWWLFYRKDEDGEILPIKLKMKEIIEEEDEEGIDEEDIDEEETDEDEFGFEQIIINTSEELWDLLERIEK